MLLFLLDSVATLAAKSSFEASLAQNLQSAAGPRADSVKSPGRPERHAAPAQTKVESNIKHPELLRLFDGNLSFP